MEVESIEVQNHSDLRRPDSFSARSSLQDIPLLLPQEADGLDAPSGEPKINRLDLTYLDQPSRVSSGLSFSFRKPKTEAVGPPDTPLKGFVDNFESLDHHEKLLSDRVAQPGMKSSDPDWWETQERGDQGDFAAESGQVGPRVSCRCQVGFNYSTGLSYYLPKYCFLHPKIAF